MLKFSAAKVENIYYNIFKRIFHLCYNRLRRQRIILISDHVINGYVMLVCWYDFLFLKIKANSYFISIAGFR